MTCMRGLCLEHGSCCSSLQRPSFALQLHARSEVHYAALHKGSLCTDQHCISTLTWAADDLAWMFLVSVCRCREQHGRMSITKVVWTPFFGNKKYSSNQTTSG